MLLYTICCRYCDNAKTFVLKWNVNLCDLSKREFWEHVSDVIKQVDTRKCERHTDTNRKKQADEQTVGGEATPMCQSVYAADTKSKQDSKMIRIQNTELIK